MGKYSIHSILSRLASDVRRRTDLHRLSERMLDLRDQGKMVEAYKVFQEFTAKAPQLSEDGDFCVFQAEFELAANSDFLKAQEFIEKAERLGCERDSFYYKVHGDVMSGTGNLEEAIVDYQRSFDLDPEISTRTSLAWVLSMSEDERVVGVCQEILQEDPDNCPAYICLGWDAVRSDDSVRALSMVKKAERSANSARDYFEVARLYQRLEQDDTAIQMYLAADRLGYRNRGASYANISACHLSSGRVAEARKWSESAIQFDPDDGYVREVWRACHDQ